MPPTPPDDRESARERVTLEDLLRLKRAERPPPEFWAGFETRLKQRQIAAAIREQRFWWRALPLALPRFAIALTAGAATTALAIGIIVWRNDARQTATPAAPATAENDSHASETAATQPPSEEHIQTAHAAFATTIAPANATMPKFALSTRANARPALTRNISSSTLMAMPVLASDLSAITTSIDSMAAEKNLVTTPDSADSAEAAAQPAVAKTDDATAGDASASSPRYDRLLSYMDTAAPPAQPLDDNPRAMRVRDRATSRLNNKVLTDSVSRFGATGDSLSIKF